MVVGSVTDSVVLDRAMAGVDLVVSAVTGFPFTNPSRVDSAGNTLLVRAAERVGAEVVLVSVAGAAPDSAMGLFRAKFDAEQALDRSWVRGTIIRPDAFADLWIELLTTSARRSHRPLVFGRGNASIGWVAVRDVASLVVRVVDQPSLRGTAYTLIGPEQISLTDLARRLMSVCGWPAPRGTYQSRPCAPPRSSQDGSAARPRLHWPWTIWHPSRRTRARGFTGCRTPASPNCWQPTVLACPDWSASRRR